MESDSGTTAAWMFFGLWCGCAADQKMSPVSAADIAPCLQGLYPAASLVTCNGSGNPGELMWDAPVSTRETM